MPDGYILLWRKSLESAVWNNANVWRFWTWCLMKATYKEHEVLVGYQKVLLQPGQFVFGRKVASKETRLSERTIRTCLEKLKSMQNLTIKTTNKFSIISIVNWDNYQNETTSKTTNKRPANDQQTTTNNKGNKGNKENNKDNTIELPEWLDGTLWNDYLEMRKSIKKPATLKAQKIAINKLVEFKEQGSNPNAIVEQSIMNSWQGLFPLKEQQVKQPERRLGKEW